MPKGSYLQRLNRPEIRQIDGATGVRTNRLQPAITSSFYDFAQIHYQSIGLSPRLLINGAQYR